MYAVSMALSLSISRTLEFVSLFSFFPPHLPLPYHHSVPESPFLHKISTSKSTVVTDLKSDTEHFMIHQKLSMPLYQVTY